MVLAMLLGGLRRREVLGLRLADVSAGERRLFIAEGKGGRQQIVRMGAFAALDQRIATWFTIKPMDLTESAAYLRHHLKLAGREEPLFADDAIARLHRVANGLPRALNNAATAALKGRPPSKYRTG